MSVKHVLTRTVAGSALAVLLGAAAATAANAHVTANPDSTTAGGFTQITFRVPTESETASTVKVKVSMPTSDPLVFVSVLPVPGWTATVTEAPLPKPVDLEGTTITKAARSVTWTAGAGQGIKPGEYQNFSISAGPLPDSGELVFPATQTYSDGEVVRWATVQKAGAPEPELPAPAFTVTAADDAASASPVAATTSTGSSDGDGSTVAGVALVVGLVALVLGLVALLRARKTGESKA